ncbi:MAG: phosphotransferase [Chloroflexi bacterium]|nr:phosphotransferase [Chloroflexota bacterium]
MSSRILESVEQLLSRDVLSAVTGQPVESVEVAPLAAPHFSGNTLESVRAITSERAIHFVLKRFSFERDWVMRLTQDYEVREVQLFRGNVYTRVPDLAIVPVVAAARDGKSWASLMVDVSDSLVPTGPDPLPAADVKRFLDHLAAIHARFMEDESLLKPALGLSSLRDFIMILSPAYVRREIDAGRSHPVLESAARGWEVFADVAKPEAARIIKRLQSDLRPLLRVIARAPRTLVHGDFKFSNLGRWVPPPAPSPAADGLPAWTPEPRTIVLDWQDATFGSPLLDLGYFIGINAARTPFGPEEVLQAYKDSLATFAYPYQPAAWARDSEVGLLAGGAMRIAWKVALETQSDDAAVRAQAEGALAWWSDQIIRAGHWIGS